MAENDTPAVPTTDPSETPSRRARFIQGLRQNQGNFRSWMQQRQALGPTPDASASQLAARVEAAKTALAARSGGAASPPPGAGVAAPIAPLAAPGGVPAAVPSAVGPVAPAPVADPPPAPTGVTWGSPEMLDYLRKYGPGTTGLGQDQVDALIGKPSGPASAATAAYNAAQQQFTANNQLYGVTGYQGNANQVASQVAGGAQSAGIPMGVLGSSFNQGGADFGGQQNAGNSLNGNNGATNWNDPRVANYGVSDASYIPTLVKSLQDAKTALGSTPVTTGQVGNFVSAIPGIVQSPQFQAGMQAQQQPQQQQASQYQAAPAQYAAAPAVTQPQVTGAPAQTAPAQSAPAQQTPIQSAPVQQNQQAPVGQVGPGSQSSSLASAIQASRQPAQQSIAAPATSQPTNANNTSQNAQVSAALNAQGQQPQQPVTQNAQRTTLAPQQTADQRAAQAGTTTKGVSQAAGGSSIITRGV